MARTSAVFIALSIAILSVPCYARRVTANDCLEHDVAIVGAGIAGAYSAYKLRNNGLDIGIYEYSDRIGGRIYTEQISDVPDQNLELGGMRLINHLHVLVQDLIKELGLTEKVFLGENDSTYPDRVFRRNVSMTAEEFRTGDIPYDLTPEEKENQADLLRYMFQKLTNDPLDNVTIDNIFDLTVVDGRYLYDLSVPESLGLVASPEALRYLLDENHFDNEEISAIDMIIEYFGAHIPDQGEDDVLTVEEGYDQIVKASINKFLEASASHSLELNTKLEAIRGTSGKYILQFRRTVTVDDETLDLHSRGSTFNVCAKKVILGLPKYGLTQVDWRPLRSRRYKDLLDGTFLAHTSKVFMTYQTPWWIDESRYPAQVLDASGLGEVYHWGQSTVSGHWTLLVSYTKLRDTDKQWIKNNGLDENLLEESIGGKLDLDDPVLVEPNTVLPRIPGSVYGANRVTAPLNEYLKKRLAMAFGIPRCGIPDPVSSIAQFWIKYPFGGGWAFTRPGYTYDELINGYRRPSDTDDVFVVGSDYSARDTTGWAEGALWTVDRMMEQFFQAQPNRYGNSI